MSSRYAKPVGEQQNEQQGVRFEELSPEQQEALERVRLALVATRWRSANSRAYLADHGWPAGSHPGPDKVREAVATICDDLTAALKPLLDAHSRALGELGKRLVNLEAGLRNIANHEVDFDTARPLDAIEQYAQDLLDAEPDVPPPGLEAAPVRFRVTEDTEMLVKIGDGDWENLTLGDLRERLQEQADE